MENREKLTAYIQNIFGQQELLKSYAIENDIESMKRAVDDVLEDNDYPPLVTADDVNYKIISVRFTGNIEDVADNIIDIYGEDVQDIINNQDNQIILDELYDKIDELVFEVEVLSDINEFKSPEYFFETYNPGDDISEYASDIASDDYIKLNGGIGEYYTLSDEERDDINAMTASYFEEGHTLQESFIREHESMFNDIITPALKTEGYPEDATWQDIEFYIEFESKRDDWSDIFTAFHHVDSREKYKSVKDDDDAYINMIVSNIQFLDMNIVFSESPEEYLETSFNIEYLAEQLERYVDTVDIEEYIDKESDTFEERLEEKARDEGFPEDYRTSDVLEYQIRVEKLNASYEMIAESLVDYIQESEKITDFCKYKAPKFIAKEDFADYTIEIKTDLADVLAEHY